MKSHNQFEKYWTVSETALTLPYNPAVVHLDILPK